MDHGKFGPPIGSSSSSDDRFGYFGGAPGPALPAATNQFGGSAAPSGNAVAGAPTNPFDGSYAVQPAYGTAPAYASPSTAATRRRVPKAAAGLAVLVVIGAGFYGWNVYQRSRPIVLPSSLAGQPVNTDPAAQAAAQSMVTSMHNKNPGVATDAKIYGTGSTGFVLLAARASENVSSDLVGGNMGPTSQIDGSTCAQALTGTISACVRTSANLTVAVLTLSGPPTTTASLLAQAWPQL